MLRPPPMFKACVIGLVGALSPVSSAQTEQGDRATAHAGSAFDPGEADRDAPEHTRLTGVHLYWDNDGTYVKPFQDSDRHYTNGAKIELTFDPAFSPAWRDRLLPNRWSGGRLAAGVVVGHQIYTPQDITQVNPPADAHPYAGYLYTGGYIQRSDGTRHDHLEFNVGVVGQNSGGEAAQKFIHAAFTDQNKPSGWDNQLTNEVTLNVRYQRSWRTPVWTLTGRNGSPGHSGAIAGDASVLGLDLIPRLGFDLGNVHIRANAEATMRLGFNLPEDFGPGRLLDYRDATALVGDGPRTDWSAYAYARVAGRAVGRDIFLDGNTFSNGSPSTDKEPFVGELTIGLVGRWKCVEAGYALTFLTDRFRAQEVADSFGSITLSLTTDF
ncbi:MAG: lipid A deacylase LpxR family protein [Planctomycetota bacterium]